MLAEGENVNVEFKECGKTLPKDVWPTYSAFANTHGGWIILGVTEHTDRRLPYRFEATGISDLNKIKTDFSNLLNDPSKINRNILSDNDIMEIDVDGAKLLVIHVQEADYRQKPIYLNGNKNRTYKRTFEGDYLLTDEEIALMVRDSMTNDGDFTIMEGCNMNHVDLETLRKYRTAFNIRNVGHPFSDMDDKTFLIQMGGYKIDELTGKEGLTLAGVLMFGKGLIVRNLFPNIRMDYLDLSNIPVGSGLKWNERLTYDGRWENNLYNFITFVMGKITFGIPSPGVVKGTIRDDDSSVYKALRESVTNSVIHSDFRIEGTLRIDKRDDSIELRNPGILKLSREKIYKGNHSRARNPKIQDMLRMIGFGDNIGSGFPLILKAWEEESWIKPDLNDDRELHEVTLKLKMSSLYAPETIQQLKECYGSDFDNLSVGEKECLVLIICEKAQTNSDLQLATGKNGWELNRILTSLTSKGILISHPNGRWTTYEPNLDYRRKKETASKDQDKGKEKGKENNKGNNKENQDKNKEAQKPIKDKGKEAQKPIKVTQKPIKENEKPIKENEKLIKEPRKGLKKPLNDVLELMHSNPSITYKEMEGLLGIKKTAILERIRKLKKLGLLKREGGRSSGVWIVVE